MQFILINSLNYCCFHLTQTQTNLFTYLKVSHPISNIIRRKYCLFSSSRSSSPFHFLSCSILKIIPPQSLVSQRVPYYLRTLLFSRFFHYALFFLILSRIYLIVFIIIYYYIYFIVLVKSYQILIILTNHSLIINLAQQKQRIFPKSVVLMIKG